MDARLKDIGRALWEEDQADLEASLRRHGVWPEGDVMELASAERRLLAVALFVKLARGKGWPASPTGSMVWALRNCTDGGLEALSFERKRRDEKRRPLKIHGAELAVVKAAAEALRLPEEIPLGEKHDFNQQMDALDGMKADQARQFPRKVTADPFGDE